MNIMQTAHNETKRIIAIVQKTQWYEKGRYARVFKEQLAYAHKKYKALCERLATSSRNLYKVIDVESGHVAAFITARKTLLAYDIYRANGGQCQDVEVRQETFGYPSELLTIYK